jgi:hypothetical protein
MALEDSLPHLQEQQQVALAVWQYKPLGEVWFLTFNIYTTSLEVNSIALPKGLSTVTVWSAFKYTHRRLLPNPYLSELTSHLCAGIQAAVSNCWTEKPTNKLC